MSKICLYFQLHQPLRLGDFDFHHIGSECSYFDSKDKTNESVFKKVSQKSYLPMLNLLLQLTKVHPEFRFTLSASGIFLEQAMEYCPELIGLLQKLGQTGQVEFLAETYYHSLSSIYSDAEFKEQVDLHKKIIKKLFDFEPKVFRNTELIYSNDIARKISDLGFNLALTEAVPRYLGERPKTKIYKSYTQKPIKLLLKHAEFSDDIAFRFSDKSWVEHPLTVEKYFHWLSLYSEDDLINLFMDFETFGEHQWEDTGIFEFFELLIARIAETAWMDFVAPSDFLSSTEQNFSAKQNPEVYDVPHPISWADIDRDLTAWLDNDLQKDSIAKLYSLECQILNSKNQMLIDDWRKLQSSDHFYYMCTKWAADGDVHAYFSPYESPYEAYRKYSIVLADLIGRLNNLAKN